MTNRPGFIGLPIRPHLQGVFREKRADHGIGTRSHGSFRDRRVTEEKAAKAQPSIDRLRG